MITFLWPWALAALPLPFLLRLLLPRAIQSNDAALKVPYLSDFELGNGRSLNTQKSRWPLLLYSLAWVCLVVAITRPQWTGDTIEIPVSGRDLMIAIDISKSMDLPIRHNLRSVSRISATKAVASEFIEKRVGDRIGLILFGDQAYVQVPLTFDRTTVTILLQEAVTGLAGQATAIGDAIGLAVKRLSEQKKLSHDILKQKGLKEKTSTSDDANLNDRVLILLTDGVSNRGEITPLKAAELAATKKLKIHTIGIGSRGSRELDERTLQQVARTTGGQYFRAYNTADLQKIYRLLDELEPLEKDVKSYRPIKSLFYIPLTVAFALAALLALIMYIPNFNWARLSKKTERINKK
jgi:Ca-activated chloride channel family protein